MSFFDKMKQGASEAAKKAQQTVEISKLRLQVAAKEKDIEKEYTLIGEAIYKGYAAGDWKKQEQDVSAHCGQIDQLKADIQALELKVQEAKNEKICRCGKVLAREVKFCPACGNRFADPPPAEAPAAGVLQTICALCQTPNDVGAKFCANCGTTMQHDS
ncbi:zinc ribbon domain-containing protein [Paenibacillus cremeus]|nr:zinc ribbon domain-containing protein [Paenibacillus cremeus]